MREWATTGSRSQTDWLDSARPVQESFCLLRVEMVYGGEIFKNHDYKEAMLHPCPLFAKKIGRQINHGLARNTPKTDDFY